MRPIVLLFVIGLPMPLKPALSSEWTAWDQMVRQSVTDGWTKEDSEALLPFYRELLVDFFTRIGVEHAGAHPNCIKDAQRAWIKLGRLLQSTETSADSLIRTLDRFQTVSAACPSLK